MRFEYSYFGQTAVGSTASATSMSFAPDTRREPTYFSGTLGRKLPFREAISALHDVVVSDLRFKPRDRSDYLAWRATQEELDWTEVATLRADVARRVEALNAELRDLERTRAQRWKGYYDARRRYFDHLWRKDREAWYVLDPVITVHPDQLFFECFSEDESTYGRLSCGYTTFDDVGEFACGTTNVDYSAALYDEFQRIRDYRTTTFKVDPAGFSVRTEGSAEHREVKIDVPDSWVRGFLQVSAAMTLPGARFSLHPMDLHNLCFALRRRREREGPRSLRWQLQPGQPVKVVLEPWGETLTCPRSVYAGSVAREIRTWGRRRLHTLERLLHVAERVDVTLLGDGQPSFFVAVMGELRFTLGLSGWTANDWSRQANFDLLVPRAEVDAGTRQRVFDALKRRWRSTPDELAAELGLDRGVVRSALTAWAQAGRALYDIADGVWRARELSREPLPLDALRFSNEREQQAAALLPLVTVREARAAGLGGVVVRGEVQDGSRRETTALTLDGDRALSAGECTCSFYFNNRLRRGPCAHMLALRLAHDRRHGVAS